MTQPESTETMTYPVLPLRDIVAFPHMIVPLFVGREASMEAVEYAMKMNRPLLLLTQKDSVLDAPSPSDLYSVGVLANVLQVLKLPDGTIKALVEGIERVHALGFITQSLAKDAEKHDVNLEKKSFFEAFVRPFEAKKEIPADAHSLMRIILGDFEQYLKISKKIPAEIANSFSKIDDPVRFADLVSGYISIPLKEKQKLLEISDVKKQLENLLKLLESEINALQVEQRIRNRIKRQVEKSQREYFLNEQMKAIQKELGEVDDGKSEFDRLEEKIAQARMSKEANNKAISELRRLRAMSPMSSEASMVRSYIECLVDLPWKKSKKIKCNLERAQKILDEEHYGLEKVKDRILEFLAVQSRVGKVGGQILCLVGPPGVGKTSLGKSIARAMDRSFVRMSLGGVRDESEVRGHRRTYIGSMPGRIIQGMKKARTTDPLFLLDEIDKLGADWRGDPSSALLEVLDPEQNTTFNDHYLEVDYDLSNVMFITTANSLNMPQPLLDRMEIIRLEGYTQAEKNQIARSYLIPRQLEKHGLKASEIDISPEALQDIVMYYTKEAGVRSLERKIAELARKVVKELSSLNSTKKTSKIRITPESLEKYLGPRKFRFHELEEEDLVGVTAGLAWTEMGGDLLTVEAIHMPGKGKATATGKLGEVMQESVQTATSLVRGHARLWGIDPKVFENSDIHVHVPEGAIPKDGPSAGITICTSLVSMFTGIPVRRDIAMTGEITLRGRVLPIGGLKEKLLAAQRAGIKKVLIPSDNEKDLVDVPDAVKNDLEIVPVSRIEAVLEAALVKGLVPLPTQILESEIAFDKISTPESPEITLSKDHFHGRILSN